MDGLLRSIPDAWGPKLATESGAVTRTKTGPNEIAMTPGAHMALVMLSPQPGREVALGGDRKSVGLAPVGGLEIVPAGADLFARWTTEKENMLFIFDESRLASLAGAELDGGNFELHPPRIGLADRRALLLAEMAREELLRGPSANPLCLESIALLLATHLLRSHSSLCHRADRFRGGLAPGTLRLITDHIRANLSGPLSIDRLAGIAGLSPGHFLRAFRTSVGQAPHQYVIARRLAEAEHLIETTDLPLAMVASATGFSSNSHLTATMRRVRGRTPRELRGRRDAAPAGGEEANPRRDSDNPAAI